MKFKTIANIVLGGTLVVSGVHTGAKLIEYKQAESTYNKMYDEISKIEEEINNELSTENYNSQQNSSTEENTAPSETISSTNNNSSPVSEFKKQQRIYEKFKKANSDYVCWITVENTNINYPVVQTTDNSYYLKKNFYKKNSSSGTIFMDTLNNFLTDKNVVLYGHNMNNKTMFNNITKFKDKKFFEKNNKITIKNTENNKEYIYEVFSVYHTNNNFNYNTVIFNEGYTYEDFLRDIKQKSMYKSNIDVTPQDKILTLATCSYEFKGAKTSVHAKLTQVRDLNPNSISNKYNLQQEDDSDNFSTQSMLEQN